jgi:hypothetical protein
MPRIAIIAETFANGSDFPQVTHRFVGDGKTKREAYAQARVLMRAHRAIDKMFGACTQNRERPRVLSGDFEGIPCRTIFRVRPVKSS